MKLRNRNENKKRTNKFKINSIRVKLIVSLVAICIIPLLIIGVTSYSKSKSILRENLTNASSQTLQEVDSGLTEYINGLSNMTSSIANNLSIGDNGVNTKNIIDMLKSIKESDKDILSVYYGTSSAKFVNYPADPVPADFNPTVRPWYKNATEKKGEIVVSSPYKDAITGKMVITIAKSVEKDGQVIGVVGMDCSLETLSYKISSKVVGKSGYVFITDASGVILAHPNKDDIGTNLAIWDLIKSDEKGFIQYEHDGKGKFCGFTTNKLTGWKVIVSMEDSELTTDTKAILNMTYLFTFIL